MLISIFGIALAIVFVLGIIFALVYIAKTGVPIWRPLGLGFACMTIGYFGASFLLLAVNAVVESSSGYSFIDDPQAAFYLALTTAVLIACLMFFMLKKPLRERASAYEALVFGLGVAVPTLVYKALGITLTHIAYIASGAGYGTSALLLLDDTLQMAITLCEAYLAVLLAYMIRQGKALPGLAAVLAAELLVYAGGSAQDAFGWSAYIGLSASVAVCAVVVFIDTKVWNSFPPFKRDARVRRGAGGNIPWPDPGEDGR
jgi:hypothetical protein